MANGNNYIVVRDGAWTLRVVPECWTPELWETVLNRLAQQVPSKHPQTSLIEQSAAGQRYYLKTFYAFSMGKALKDSLRLSKALRAQRIGAELAAAGFHAPVAVAAGEKRKRFLVECAFLLTVPVAGVSLIEMLQQRGADQAANRASKLAGLRQLAQEIRRFHDLGFVHGDMVATNIFVHDVHPPWRFFFMDNDRTRRYPQALPRSQWKRNLVQFNRMPLPGISLQDRMRFLRAYLGDEFASKDGAALARWLEEKTRRRRWECDGARAESFRCLMRWDNSTHREVEHA